MPCPIHNLNETSARSMTQFIIRRLLLLFPVLLGILLVTFVIIRLIPGDPCVVMLGERATPDVCRAFRERLGLADPLPIQFVRYLVNLAHGDLGVSFQTGQPVGVVLTQRLPMTIELTVFAMLFASIFGVLAGIVSAVRRNSAVDVATMLGANAGISMPVFWLGLMLAYVFALLLKGTPVYIPPSSRLTAGLSVVPLEQVWHLKDLSGLAKLALDFVSNSAVANGLLTGNWKLLRDALWHLILPSVAVGTIPLAIIARMTRSSLLETLGQDYIRAARAKGLSRRVVLLRHALRNALIPIVTIIGLEVGSLLSGAVLTETIFNLPGMGTAIVTAVLARDYPVVQGFTIAVAVIYVVVNMLVDFSYAYLDPRIGLD